MHISALRIKNFRRLNDVLVDLAEDISIFVGSNNSGKTSTAHALQLFVKEPLEKFSIHDFSSSCWPVINSFGQRTAGVALPKISIDFWFKVAAPDLHRVINLLPSLDWQGTEVGLRVEFCATNDAELLARYDEAKAEADANIQPAAEGRPEYRPPPRNLVDYLTRNLRKEFSLFYYALDRGQFNAQYVQNDGYIPPRITTEAARTGKNILDSLMRVDVLNAQRHLSDKTGGHRSEDLSRQLGRFYSRNLERQAEDHAAMRALSQAEDNLNTHLAGVFAPILERLSAMGYPHIGNLHLIIKSGLNPAAVMNAGDEATKVHYALDPNNPNEMTLPDRYNGLGFKNFIYIVVDLLDRHAQWMEIEENRPPLHLILIEEPEVHLHTQLQQVFIRNILEILRNEDEDAASYRSQLVVTTHSPHILYERGFSPIRYFRRSRIEGNQTSEVLNLSQFYRATEPNTRDFLERYMKLTHCDMFFADAAILVEGNVERLLIPQMILKAAPRLNTICLSILEVGGAYAYRFRLLVEFLGLTTLVVTDIDSVHPTPPAAQPGPQGNDGAVAEEEEDDEEEQAGTACLVNTPDAVTCNQTLIQWLPARTSIADLLVATQEQSTQAPGANNPAHVRVAYQRAVNTTWDGNTQPIAGRTLEEAFVFHNLAWCQHLDRKVLNLRIARNQEKTLDELVHRLHNRIKSSNFKKTDFALALLTLDPVQWQVPQYIDSGLKWLEQIAAPAPVQAAEEVVA